MKWVRIRLDQIANEDPSPIIVTVPVDDNRQIALGIPHAGWWGIPKGNNWCRPIVFKPNGMVDFGGDPETENVERYAEMQIFERPFALGDRYYMKDFEDGSVSQFVVREISDL